MFKRHRPDADGSEAALQPFNVILHDEAFQRYPQAHERYTTRKAALDFLAEADPTLAPEALCCAYGALRSRIQAGIGPATPQPEEIAEIQDLAERINILPNAREKLEDIAEHLSDPMALVAASGHSSVRIPVRIANLAAFDNPNTRFGPPLIY